MELLSFKEYVARRDEGLLSPTRQPLKGLPRINTFPTTDTHRKWLRATPAGKPKPFAPTVHKVKEIVPQNLIPKLKPPHNWHEAGE
jgi:hypothetical protein